MIMTKMMNIDYDYNNDNNYDYNDDFEKEY